MAKEFILEQRFTDGAHIDGAEWPIGAIAEGMNFLGDHLLSGSRLSGNDHTVFCGRHNLHLPQHPCHGMILCHQILKHFGMFQL